jgi:hypothetical protein
VKGRRGDEEWRGQRMMKERRRKRRRGEAN